MSSVKYVTDPRRTELATDMYAVLLIGRREGHKKCLLVIRKKGTAWESFEQLRNFIIKINLSKYSVKVWTGFI
jgi:hypothetical protein